MAYTNAWGEPVEPDTPEDNPYWVPEDQRKDTDDDADANALGGDEEE